MMVIMMMVVMMMRISDRVDCGGNGGSWLWQLRWLVILLFTNTIKFLQTLHFRGANIESRDKDNYTPLLVAVAQGNKEATDALLVRNANVRVKDSSDKTAIYIAAEENCLDILKVSVKGVGPTVLAHKKIHSPVVSTVRVIQCFSPQQKLVLIHRLSQLREYRRDLTLLACISFEVHEFFCVS